MSKIFDQPIRVKTNRLRPVGFFWRKRWHEVRDVIDSWVEKGRWWEGEGEKSFYRVETAGGGFYELYREGDNWWLYRVFD